MQIHFNAGHPKTSEGMWFGVAVSEVPDVTGQKMEIGARLLERAFQLQKAAAKRPDRCYFALCVA